ncbi:hypothetical protein NM208_g6542 [Fusarium decemcellulare]|uniref:Uncharacterized protein n=1 Tax=Fusarium decemcellulare TaxID=57161 RepID=A0ACC1SCK4_9HYPO|nr:hypothetical protein NM208_g6542 [Fusarium decemcellulare]
MAPLATEDGNASAGHARYNDLGWKVENERGYRIPEHPFGTTRKLRVIHVGAGASGICFTKFAEDLLENVEFQLYEKNGDFGGTWLENRYPGCACDIPSACYQFTWARNPNWSQYYSGSREIWQYFKDVAEKHQVGRFVKFNHTVVGAQWNADEGLWHVKVMGPNGDTFIDTCNVFINGGGVLNKWKWPDIKGLHTFKGSLQHSAHYDESLDLTGKRVAVIGIGSSGVQIISNIAPIVEKLYTWVRSPTWITAAFAQRFAGKNGNNFSYTAEQKEKFSKDPELFLKYSKTIESELNKRFKFILNNTPEAKDAKNYALKEMTQKLSGNQKLMDAIIPGDFGVGCRRPTPGNGFLEALNAAHVTVFTDEMREITQKGFIDSKGQQHEIDVIICATGFDTSWIPRYPVVANGFSVADMWKEEALAYLSIAVPHIPNYFLLGGPYGPHGHGSYLPILEATLKYIFQVIKKMQVDRIKSLAPKTDIVEAFKEHADLFLSRTAWASGCSSWFKQGRKDGPLPMFPGTRIAFFELLESPRYEHYDLQYCNSLNPFEFLGNGFSVREFDGRDLSWYLGLLGGHDIQSDLGSLTPDLLQFIPPDAWE